MRLTVFGLERIDDQYMSFSFIVLLIELAALT